MARVESDSSVFFAIADPTRRAILDRLREGEGGAMRLFAEVARRGMTQSAFSQHLAVLRRAGLVASRKSGRHRIYSLNPAPLAEVYDWAKHYDRFWTDRLERLGEFLGKGVRAANYLDPHASDSAKHRPNDGPREYL